MDMGTVGGTAHVIRRHLTCALDGLPHYFFSQNQCSLHLLSLHSMKVKSKRKVIHKKSRKLQTIHPTFISSITLIRFQVTQHTNFQMKGGQSFKPSIAVRTYRTQQPPTIMITQTWKSRRKRLSTAFDCCRHQFLVVPLSYIYTQRQYDLFVR